MLKKIGVPVMALLGILAFAPHQAKAAIRFGVVVGRPVYTYPVYPDYPPAEVVPAPVYGPAYVDGYIVRHELRRDWDRDRDDWRYRRDRDHDRDRDHEYRDHDRDFRDRR